MTGDTANGQGATRGTGARPPDASEVVEHLKAASQELAAAGKAFLEMVDEAIGGLLTSMTGWSGWSGWGDPQRGEEQKPRVERIDVEDERGPKEG